ncbi:MAG: peptidylprolyl isomerase [Trueperaceae bacterium]|nr:peptidylprolyl isomerase [Trueperaceae bacterium]
MTPARFALLNAVVALLVGGAWIASRSTDPPPRDATAAPSAASATDATPEAAEGTGPAANRPLPRVEGYEPVPFVADAPVRTFEAADDVLEADLEYVAVLETTNGTVHLDLFERRTPATTNNFVFLALHRFYEGVPFHRVIDGFMAQTGDPTGTGRGGPGYRFDDEIADGLAHDAAGVVSMANAGEDTNGSQFFVTFGPTPWLDGAHTIFGRVVEGLDVLEGLTRVEPGTPTIIAPLDGPARDLAEQGVDAADVDGTVRAWLERELGALPDGDAAFEVGGLRGVLGASDGAPALGLFPDPDRLVRVSIHARPAPEDPS